MSFVKNFFLGLLFSLFLLQTGFAGYIEFLPGYEKNSYYVKGRGFDSSKGNKQVNFYVDKDYYGKTTMEKGRFSKVVYVGKNSQKISAKILQYSGKSKNDHYVNTYTIDKNIYSNELIKFGQIENRKATICGLRFNKDRKYQVNFYVNDKFQDKVFMENGRFNYTVRDVSHGDKLKIKVLQYKSNGKHLENKIDLTEKIKFNQSYKNPYIKFNSLNSYNEVKVSFYNLDFKIKSKQYHVNLYLNGKYVGQKIIKKNDSNKFFYVPKVNIGDKISIKILNYGGPGKNFDDFQHINSYTDYSLSLGDKVSLFLGGLLVAGMAVSSL